MRLVAAVCMRTQSDFDEPHDSIANLRDKNCKRKRREVSLERANELAVVFGDRTLGPECVTKPSEFGAIDIARGTNGQRNTVGEDWANTTWDCR